MSAEVFAAIDLELTGLKPRSDEIIEIGVVRCTPERVLERWSTLVRPTEMPPLRIQRLTGITPEMLEGAPPFKDVEAKLRALLDGAALIGHNIAFDESFLEAVDVRAEHPSTDTLQLAQIVDPTAPSHRLGDLCARYGIELDDAHRALADAEASRRLLLALRERFGRLPAQARRDLVELCLSHGMLWPTGQTLVEWAGGSSPETDREVQGYRAFASDPARAPLPRGSLVDLTAQAFGSDDAEFERRDEQLAMALDVANTLQAGGTAIVEAGTGTGKSLAYLVPAALWALKTGRRVGVSTHTINLQQQLETKDLPMARRLIARVSLPASEALRGVVIKGRGHYLCRRQLRREVERAARWSNPQLLARALVWDVLTERGDRAELRLPSHELSSWERLSAAATTCLIDGCRFVSERSCFLTRIRDEASSAHIVVMNHALLVSDLVYGSATLPATDVVIIDEAHALEDVATDQMAAVMDEEWVRESVQRAQQEEFTAQSGSAAPAPSNALASALADAVPPLQGLYDQLGEFAVRHSEDSFGGHDQVVLTRGARSNPAWLEVEKAAERASLALTSAVDAAATLHDELEQQMPSTEPAARRELMTLSIEAQQFGSDLRERIGQLNRALTVASDEEIAWIRRERRRSGAAAVHSAPLSVAEHLLPLWLERHASVLTGATLATGPAEDGGFAYLSERLGIEDAAESQYGSPFDYENSCRIYIPSDAVDAAEGDHSAEVGHAVPSLAEAAGGRTMALFRSYSAMRQAARVAEPLLEEAGLVLAMQGRDGSPARIVEALRSGRRTVAFGVASLWTGIDVPGDALSLLIITRLPFAPVGDPVLQARGEQYENEFIEFTLPAAILQFRQGFGRLLRTRTDKGAVVVLDARIDTRRYGAHFLRALPPAPVSRIPLAAVADDLRQFLPLPRG